MTIKKFQLFPSKIWIDTYWYRQFWTYTIRWTARKDILQFISTNTLYPRPIFSWRSKNFHLYEWLYFALTEWNFFSFYIHHFLYNNNKKKLITIAFLNSIEIKHNKIMRKEKSTLTLFSSFIRKMTFGTNYLIIEKKTHRVAIHKEKRKYCTIHKLLHW